MKIEKWEDSVIKTYFDDMAISVLWFADLHLDSIATDRDKIKNMIDNNPDAYLVIGGDSYDVMQNTGDRRASKGALKAQYDKPSYLNEIIDDLVSFFKPYANRIIGFNYGNHETSQLKFHGIDLIKWVVGRLNLECNTSICVNDFQGYYIFNLNYYGKLISYVINYSHKPISGGSRSKGMLSVDLITGRNPDADMYISEHIHQTFSTPIVTEHIDHAQKNLVYREKWYVQAPTMKAEHEGNKQGYHFERNFGHTWNGALLINIAITRHHRDDKSNRSAYIIAEPKLIRA